MAVEDREAVDVAKKLAAQAQQLKLETRELDLLIESTQAEVDRLRLFEEQAGVRVVEMQRDPADLPREQIFGAYTEFAEAMEKRVTMEGQLTALQSKRKLMDRVNMLVAEAATVARGIPIAAPEDDAAPLFDETRLLQAVIDTQEEERQRLARQVHDGPAQALSNVVLQAEISERLFEVDPQRSRIELAGLRQQVNKTLQELRGFIFELRPMILDDLGLVPTMRRYVQTLVEKHAVRVEFSSTGRDRRLPSDDEVAIFRLIQDSLVERIERGGAKQIQLGMAWKDEVLETFVQSDGKELPTDAELSSGLRRSERLELLKAESVHQQRADGTILLGVRIPLRTKQPIS
jgi:two-component system sensor histidine kinase DegS